MNLKLCYLIFNLINSLALLHCLNLSYSYVCYVFVYKNLYVIMFISTVTVFIHQ